VKIFAFYSPHNVDHGAGCRRVSRSSGLAKDGAVIAHRNVSYPRNQEREVDAAFGQFLSDRDLDTEIDFAAYMANKVLAKLMTKCETIFPQKKEPWYQANDEDVQK
jgi:hypothetical protein